MNVSYIVSSYINYTNFYNFKILQLSILLSVISCKICEPEIILSKSFTSSNECPEAITNTFLLTHNLSNLKF